MNIIIPMAGLGLRFSKSGFSLPKPLINIVNKPMYRHAAESLPLHLASRLIFILREGNYCTQLEEDIHQHYGHISHCHIVRLAKETEGQAETVFRSKEYLDLHEPTLIHNCDTYIKKNFNWQALCKEEIDGAMVLFHSCEPRWSYAKLDKNNEYVIDVQEKKVISSHASTGTYYFKDTTALLATIEKNIKENTRQNNEFYLSTVYQHMLQQHKKIIPLWTKKMMCFGTPQDLVESLNIMLLTNGVLP